MFRIIRITVKKFIAYILYYIGVLNVLAKKRLKNKAVILMYHRVLDESEIQTSFSQRGIIVRKSSFAKHMKYLQKRFNVLSLSDTIGKIRNKVPFESKSCLITFDDGWRDNYLNAYPILKETKTPAVIFLPTDFVGTDKRFWQEILAESLKDLHFYCQQDKSLIDIAKYKLNTDGISEICTTHKKKIDEKIEKFVSFQKGKQRKGVQSLIDNLESIINRIGGSRGRKEAEFLDWNEVKTMSKNGIEFGSHGKSHVILTRMSVDLKPELSESKAVLELRLNTTVKSFSYPNGDYNEGISEQVQQCGYDIAFGTNNGFVTHKDNPYTLKRINIHEDMTNSIPMFLSRIVGLW